MGLALRLKSLTVARLPVKQTYLVSCVVFDATNYILVCVFVVNVSFLLVYFYRISVCTNYGNVWLTSIYKTILYFHFSQRYFLPLCVSLPL